MRQFMVQFRSFWDLQDFVALASKQKVKLFVGNEPFWVNATSVMSMLALNCRKPQKVTAECSEEQLQELLTVFDRFLVR